jgi:Predicted nucleic acid-binding protein, contains PIN domain
MTDSKKIFLDTSPLIYYLQKNELYYPSMVLFWDNYVEYDYVTSSITITEYLTYPYRYNDLRMINEFYSFIYGMDIQMKAIGEKIADKAAQIRAGYKFFKTMDALQLATACITGCELFLTNDKQLKQFREIRCITLDDLENL